MSDRLCDYCGTRQRTFENCRNCGAPDRGDKRKLVTVRVGSVGQIYQSLYELSLE